jgi:hypothetical protein
MNAATYEAYRENKIASGLAFQDFVVNALYQARKVIVMQYSSVVYQQAVGESCTGVEIKHDEKFATTGNLWIEIAEKARPREGDYVPSGIYRTDNTWLYVIGDYSVVFAFTITSLRAFHRCGQFTVRENNTRTSQGFLMREQDARKSAAFVLEPKASHTVSEPITSLEKLGRILYAELSHDPRQLRLFDK